MERLVEGDIIVIYFPFSNLTELKKRPALVMKKIAGNDLILCQITSRSFHESEELIINNEEIKEGNLKRVSYVRFTKLFTADESLVNYKIGRISSKKLDEILNALCKYLKP